MRPGWTGRALTAWASRAAHSCSLIISERRVGSGATGVYASPSRGRLTARLDSRCNGWNKRPQIALAQWLSAKKLVACMREADGLWARASRQFLGIDDMVSRRCGAGHIISL